MIEEDEYEGERDFYCWTCKKTYAMFHCRSCARVFHYRCLFFKQYPPVGVEIVPTALPTEEDSKTSLLPIPCPQCEYKLPTVEYTSINLNSQDTLIRIIIRTYQKLESIKIVDSRDIHRETANPFKELNREDDESPMIYPRYPMDLKTILNKISERKYKSLESFYGDVCWIAHNSLVTDGIGECFNSVIAVAMKRLCYREIRILRERCIDCHERPKALFNKPCDIPHILLWVKLFNYPYWPAKLIGVNKSEGMVYVLFFGDCLSGSVKFDKAYGLSKELPSCMKKIKMDDAEKKKFKEAKRECKFHIKNLKKVKRFGGQFKYFKQDERLDFSNLDLLRQKMLPKYAIQDREKITESEVSGDDERPAECNENPVACSADDLPFRVCVYEPSKELPKKLTYMPQTLVTRCLYPSKFRYLTATYKEDFKDFYKLRPLHQLNLYRSPLAIDTRRKKVSIPRNYKETQDRIVACGEPLYVHAKPIKMTNKGNNGSTSFKVCLPGPIVVG